MANYYQEYLKLKRQQQLNNDGIISPDEWKRVREWQKTHDSMAASMVDEYNAKKFAKKQEQDEGLDFFDSGAFGDNKGNFFTDLADTIGGTVVDFAMSPVKGLLNMGEGIVDLAMYGVGGVADFLGADGLADGARNAAKYEAVNSAYDAIGINDKIEDSVFGKTSQAILEGVGQVGGMMISGGIAGAAGLSGTAVTAGSMFASSAGQGISEAYKGGATDGEATAYGLTKGAIDAATEMMFGGLGKGVNALGYNRGLLGVDDMLASAAGKAFKSKVGKTIAQMGIKATAEGVEELAAGYLTAHAKKGTYQSEEEFEKILNDEKLLEQFIVGTAVGGIMQGGNVSQSLSGRDMITGLTENEQMVLDKEIEDRIKAAEESGNELNNKDKKKIREDAKKDLERGYISIDTIESALSPQTYDRYKKVVDSETKLENEISELENMPNAEITVKQSERLQEARKELEELRTKDEKSTLKSMLNEEVRKATEKDSYLAESYNERARRGKKYEANVEEYDEAQREIIQKAIDSGILNNSNKTHAFVDLMAKLAADKGLKIDFANNKKIQESGFAVEGKTINGYVQGDNIVLNVSSDTAIRKVVGHEITHILEGTEMYAELQEAVKQYAETKGEYEAHLQEIQSNYQNVENANIENELTSDLVGEYLFTDEDFVNNLSTKKPNIFKRIYNEIKYFVKQVMPGSQEAKQLEKVKRMFDKAYKENVAIQENGNVTYSLMEFSQDGKRFVEIDQEQDRFEGHDRSEYPAIAKQIINEKFNGKVIGTENKTFINGRGRDEYVHPSKPIKDDYIYDAKMRASSELDNLMDAGSNFRNEADGRDGHIHKNAIGGFDYYDTIFKVGDNYFKAKINIENIKKGKLFKDITKIEDVTEAIMNSYGPSPKFQFLRTSSNSIIPELEQNTSGEQQKVRYSITEVPLNKRLKGDNSSEIYGRDLIYDPTLDESPKTEDALGPVREVNPMTPDDMGPVREDLATSDGIIDMPDDLPIGDDLEPNPDNFGQPIMNVKDRNAADLETRKVELARIKQLKEDTYRQYNREIAQKQNQLYGKKNKNTKAARKLNQRIIELKRMRDEIDAQFDLKISKLTERIDKMNSSEFKVAEQRQYKAEQRLQTMGKLMGDTSTWKDKSMGLQYGVNTLKRNLRDVVRDEHGNRDIAKADAIYDFLMGSYNRNEAKLNREANRIRKQFKDLKINKWEDQYIQMLGEYKYNPDTTLTNEVVDEFYQKHKSKIDTAKVDKAIDMARATYDDLFKRVNEILKAEGMQEIPYREGYFPHFTQEQQGFFGKLLNWKKENNSIPTDIAGLTEQFKPSKSYQSFAQHRHGDTTDYSVLKGLDSYTQGALDWIYHIGDIQNFRAFENEIRYRHSEARIQEQIKKIDNDETLDAEQAQALKDGVFAEAKNPLNNLVQNIRTHTNLLAGKKNTMDRNVESETNRQIYSVSKNLSSRVTVNMVGASISSALTNFIPITQSWSQVSPRSTLKAMKATLKSIIKDDGTIAKSDFLTNRLQPADTLSKTTGDKVTEAAFFLMSSADYFSSQTIWRSKYMENIDAGMSENEAIKDADNFAEGVMAGRSRGNMPVLMEAKNPLIKMYTAFQLEVANQYGYMIKDMPQDMKNKTAGRLIKAYGSMFLGAYAYNALFSQLTGRNAAFDPLRILEELLRDLGLGGDDEEEGITDAIMDFGGNIVDELPFVGTLTGGGRIPISSALPYDNVVDMFTGTAEDWKNGNWNNLTKEWLNPFYYLVLPAGGGQIKKTNEGLAMFDDDLPISGSYTNTGNLRYAVEDTPLNRIQASLFGQWANENAQDYIDNERQTMKSKQIEEFAELHDLGMTQKEYWDYREGLKDLDSLSEKVDYIVDLDLSTEQKNIMVNNLVDRKEEIDVSNYDDFSEYEEFDFYLKNPEKHTLSKAIGTFKEYTTYTKALNSLKSDKDGSGNSISGSRKQKVLTYINGLDATYETKIILYKMEYPSDNRYNNEIIEYLNKREDISYKEMETILKELGFKVEPDGTIRW